jgi:hypothetical protein
MHRYAISVWECDYHHQHRRVQASRPLQFGMSHEPEMAALNDALAMMKSAPSAIAERQLVDATCALVAVLQEAGWPIERVLAQVKHVAAHAGFAKVAMSAGDELRSPEEIIVDRLVRVCIAHYYRDDAH